MTVADRLLSNRRVESDVHVLWVAQRLKHLLRCDDESQTGQVCELLLSMSGEANWLDHLLFQ